MDQRIVDFVADKWCVLRLATATDQYLAINQTTGIFAAFPERAPKKSHWFHFLIVPRDVHRNQFWLFSRAARGGAGELVSQQSGLRQWRFEGGLWQCFEITPLMSYAKNRMVRLTLVADSKAVSTRWSSAAFLWELTESDKQQMLHLEGADAITLPTLPEIDCNPGETDKEMLKVESFDGAGVLDVTPKRVAAAQLVAFPFVTDTYTPGRQMRETPYYLLTRRCFWKKVKSREYPAAGVKVETLEWEIGFRETDESELEKSLLVTVGAKMTYAPNPKVGGGGGEVSFAREIGEKWTRRRVVERYEKVKGSYSVSYADGQRVLLVVWALVNQYTLERTNGDVIGEVEFIEKGDEVAREYSEREAER
jgi:hypothetical protein